ncbi:MAG: hypothetical protein KIT13_02660 [Burkholderiales bacterium]|nr:hypothetical protein [Burkholderiales bacterium]
MRTMMPAIGLFLLSLAARADEAAAVPMPGDASPTALIVFGLLFVVLIAGFGIFIVMQDRKSKNKSAD